jgi:hypothetical protein
MTALNPGRCTRGAAWFVFEGSIRDVATPGEGLFGAEEASPLEGPDDLPLVALDVALKVAFPPELLVLPSSR